jgi:hypothetical protein
MTLAALSSTETVLCDQNQAVVCTLPIERKKGSSFPFYSCKVSNADSNYKPTSIEGKPLPDTGGFASDAWWMNHGLRLDDETQPP